MENKFDGTLKTKSGIETKDVRFNSIPGAYLGKVMYEGRFITCMWDKRGKCKDKRFPQFDLV